MNKHDDYLFSNTGGKIKKFASISTRIGMIISILFSGYLFLFGCFNIRYLWWLIFISPIICAFFCFLSWLSSLALYGFGQLIEDVNTIKEMNSKNTNSSESKQELPKTKNYKIEKANSTDNSCVSKEFNAYIEIECPRCHEVSTFKKGDNNIICPYCNAKIILDNKKAE